MPAPNHLVVSGKSDLLPITWLASDHSEKAVLLLPVKIKGIDLPFYMQFDTGASSTILYEKTLSAIQAKFPDQIGVIDTAINTIQQNLLLGNMTIHSDQFRLYDRGVSVINWDDEGAIPVIGTLGADLIDQRISIIDFKRNRCFFGIQIPEAYRHNLEMNDFKYKMRKTMFPAIVAGRQCNLLHDTGTSGFELITDEATWKELAAKEASMRAAFEVQSWNQKLLAYNIASDDTIYFQQSAIPLTKVTYIEGASFMQHLLMRATGMGGMIGNEVFEDKVLVIDCQNQQYGILD